jgi:hypothetical protein
MAKKRSKKVQATAEPKAMKAVRLDLTLGDHAHLEGLAEERGLSMASFVRMVLKERMNELPPPKKPAK